MFFASEWTHVFEGIAALFAFKSEDGHTKRISAFLDHAQTFQPFAGNKNNACNRCYAYANLQQTESCKKGSGRCDKLEWWCFECH